MAALPLTQKGVDINLPAETKRNTDAHAGHRARSCVEYTADRHISINKQDITLRDLETRLRNIYEQRKDKTMFLVGAGTLRYGEIVAVIDAAKGAGVEKVGIVTDRHAAGRGRRARRRRQLAPAVEPGSSGTSASAHPLALRP